MADSEGGSQSANSPLPIAEGDSQHADSPPPTAVEETRQSAPPIGNKDRQPNFLPPPTESDRDEFSSCKSHSTSSINDAIGSKSDYR